MGNLCHAMLLRAVAVIYIRFSKHQNCCNCQYAQENNSCFFAFIHNKFHLNYIIQQSVQSVFAVRTD